MPMRRLGILMREIGVLMTGTAKLRTVITFNRLSLLSLTPLSIAKEAFGKQVSAAYMFADQCTTLVSLKRLKVMFCLLASQEG